MLLRTVRKTLPPNSLAVVGRKRALLRNKLHMREREAERKAERDALLAAQLPTVSPSPRDDPQHWDKMASAGFRRIQSSLHPNGSK